MTQANPNSLSPDDQRETNFAQAAEQVVSELRQIPRFNSVLRQQLANIVSETEKAAFDIASQLQTIDQVVSDLSRTLDKPSIDSTELIDAVRESNQRLADMFMTALASVQFQDVTRQQIDQVIGALDRLDLHSEGLAHYLASHEDERTDFQPLSEHLEEIFDQYVMESQRDSHRMASDVAETEAAPRDNDSSTRVELF
jgi:methyl-accepting chemotaxis protein